MEPVQLAAVLAAVVVLASMLSVELGIAVALLELTLNSIAWLLCLAWGCLHVEQSSSAQSSPP